MLNPSAPDSACYLYKVNDSRVKEEYQADSVPVHVVRIRPSRLAYLVEMSDKDEKSTPVKGRAVSWSPRCEDGWPYGTATAGRVTGGGENKPCQRFNRFERYGHQGRLGETSGDATSLVLDRRDIQLITNKVVEQLNAKIRQQGHGHGIDGAGKHDTFSVDDEDVQKIVEASILEVGRITSAGDLPGPRRQESGRRTDAFALPELDNRSIKPRPSAAADPATTISIPKTLFAGFTTGNSQKDTPMTATVVSRQSVTEITWTKYGGHLGDLSDSLGGSDILSHGDSESTSPTRRTSVSPDPPPHYRSQGEIQAVDSAGSITSFPNLGSRHCTKEWIRPPLDLEDLNRTLSSDLYCEGVDAHCGGACHHPARCPEEPLHGPWAGNWSSFHDAPGDAACATWQVRRSTIALPSLTTAKGFGSLIGSASHRRRSAPVCDFESAASQDSFLASLMGKILRSSSQKKTHGGLAPKDALGSGALAPHNSPAGGHHSVSSLRSRDGSYWEQMPGLSETDSFRIHEAMTRNRLVVDDSRGDRCSEDNRPHVCENDMEILVRWADSVV